MPSFPLAFPGGHRCGCQATEAMLPAAHGTRAAEGSVLEQDGQHTRGGTGEHCCCSTALSGFGACRFTALMQH